MLKLKGTIAISGLTLSLLMAQPSAYAEETPSKTVPQVPAASEVPAAAAAHADVDIKVLSEAFGHFIGRNLKSPGVQFDVDSIIKGIREGASGAPAPMNDQEYEVAMMKLQEQAYEALSKDNLQAANAFLIENKGKTDVIEIEPGKLQYTVLTPGTGAEVQKNATPLINYKGTYIDGTTFGSSEEVGGPITIPLDQTIPGFSKGIVGMKEGEKRRLFIHPDLGYGTLGNLPPNALLIFDIEVMKADAGKDGDGLALPKAHAAGNRSAAFDGDEAMNDEGDEDIEIDEVDIVDDDDDEDDNDTKKTPAAPASAK